VLWAAAGASWRWVSSSRSRQAGSLRAWSSVVWPSELCTWKVKLAYAAPLALAAGLNLSQPAAISAAETNCPAPTAKPLTVSVPRSEERRVGRVEISVGGVSLEKMKRKAAGRNGEAASY